MVLVLQVANSCGAGVTGGRESLDSCGAGVTGGRETLVVLVLQVAKSP